MGDMDCEFDDCAAPFEQCGGNGFNMSMPCCEDTNICVVKNKYYAQCAPSPMPADAALCSARGSVQHMRPHVL